MDEYTVAFGVAIIGLCAMLAFMDWLDGKNVL